MHPTVDPARPLAGPPDPWSSTDQPVATGGPPFHMTAMIEAEPAIAERIIERLAARDGAAAELARAVRRAAAAGEPIVVTGCGTSEHAAQGVAQILAAALSAAPLRPTATGAMRPRPILQPVPAQAFELSLDPPSQGLVIGVSHEGATTATNAALEAARKAGARTALITVTDRSPGAAVADIVVATEELDHSWCHTVGYTGPLVAAVAVGGHVVGGPLGATEAAAIRELMSAGAGRGAVAEAIAVRLANAERILVIASGADRPAGRELVLKIEEGTWIPAAYRDVETLLHGHLAATDDRTALVLILADRHARPERLARATGALRAAGVIGMEAAAIVTADIAAELPTDLTPAGRLVVPEAPDLSAPAAALLSTATALQLLTERLARVRGVDPDPIHRDLDRYRDAADAADA